MDMYKFNKKKNITVFTCWFLISLVLTIAYIVEVIIGNRTAYYTTTYIMFIWVPMMISYAISLIIGRGDLNIKYAVGVSYMVFYVYTQLTSNSLATFTYIFPMLCVLLVYNDLKLTDSLCIGALLLNIICIACEVATKGSPNVETITFWEIEIVCLSLCTVFLHKTTILLIYSDHMLMELNEEIGTDQLTSLYNRNFLHQYLKDKFKGNKDESISLAIIDADAFKSINDNYGHKFGDLVLRKIAAILREVTEDFDNTYPIRVGGDEFLIISAEIDRDQMYRICKRMCNILDQTSLRYGETDVKFSVSIGVTNSTVDNKHKYQELFDEADKLLYTVKVNGKNSVAKSDNT
jgi:diguanylate cyclase (GGDEF)-like protein